MEECFASRANDITNRAIDANIGNIGVLCDRGKYIHPDYLVINKDIIDTVNNYIDNSSRSILSYGELFENLKTLFEGSQITNRYLLQGALKKYGCRYNTGRDYIRKTKTVSFVDEFESFIEERGIVNKTEILAEFTSIGESGLSQVVSRSANVFNIDNGYYIHANQFDIQPEDYEQLRSYLNEVCENIPVNIRSVYETIADKYPDFFYRNDFDDRNKLFAALNYMFRGEFVFSRPYVAKLGASDISNRSVILQHIKDYDTIEIEELIDICEENNIDYLSPGYLCQSLAPDYLRINRTTMMRFELTGITNEVIDQTIEIVNEYLEVNDFIAGSKISDFLWYPSINIDWNAFLLESLVLNCKKIAVVNMLGDSLKHPNAIYVSSKYEKDTYDSFLIKLLKDEVHKGTFLSKVEIKEWLKEEGLIDAKLPKCIESTKYFYVSEKGVRCTVE